MTIQANDIICVSVLSLTSNVVAPLSSFVSISHISRSCKALMSTKHKTNNWLILLIYNSAISLQFLYITISIIRQFFSILNPHCKQYTLVFHYCIHFTAVLHNYNKLHSNISQSKKVSFTFSNGWEHFYNTNRPSLQYTIRWNLMLVFHQVTYVPYIYMSCDLTGICPKYYVYTWVATWWVFVQSIMYMKHCVNKWQTFCSFVIWIF